MSYAQPTVVLTGGAGYIGSVLSRQLVHSGYKVRIFDNFLYGDAGVSKLDGLPVEVIEGDICDTRALANALNDAEIVIHLASLVGRRSVDTMKRNGIRNVNLLATSLLLDAAVEFGASRFIFASSDSVYGLQSGVMYETTTPEPISLHSRLKLRVEERVINARSRHFHPTVMRIATAYGYSPRMRFDLVANSMMRDAIVRGEIIIENGSQVRPLIHVEDVGRAFISAVSSHVNLISGEIFNVGASNQTVEVGALANMIANIVPDVKISFIDGEADLVDYRLSCSKIEKVLDFTTTREIEESLREVADYLQSGAFQDPYSLRYSNT